MFGYVKRMDHRDQKITPQGYVTTIAGNGNLGYVNGPDFLQIWNSERSGRR